MRPPRDFKAPAPSQYQELVEWMSGRFQELFEVAETLSYTNAALARVLKVSPKKFNKFAQQVDLNRKYIESLQAEAKAMASLAAGIPRRKKSLWSRIKGLFSSRPNNKGVLGEMAGIPVAEDHPAPLNQNQNDNNSGPEQSNESE